MLIDDPRLRYDAFRSVKNNTYNAFEKTVYADELPSELVNPSHTLILSGPPLLRLALTFREMLTPLGMLQSAEHSSQRSVVTVNEFGAASPRHFPGRMQHSVTLQRVVGSQGNALGLLYRWLIDYNKGGYNVAPLLPVNLRGQPLQATSASEMIDVPFGLYLAQFTETGKFIAAWYWERCLLQGHARSLNANNPTVLENVQLIFAREVAAPNLIDHDSELHPLEISDDTGTPPDAEEAQRFLEPVLPERPQFNTQGVPLGPEQNPSLNIREDQLRQNSEFSDIFA